MSGIPESRSAAWADTVSESPLLSFQATADFVALLASESARTGTGPWRRRRSRPAADDRLAGVANRDVLDEVRRDQSRPVLASFRCRAPSGG